MVQIETLFCNKREAEAKERFYYEQLNDNLNGKKPFIDTDEKKDIKREKDKEYRVNNDEKVKARKKEYYENNKIEIAEKTKEYRGNNKDKIKERKQEYYQRNKEKLQETFICECGSVLTFNSKARHLKTKIHLDYINNLETN